MKDFQAYNATPEGLGDFTLVADESPQSKEREPVVASAYWRLCIAGVALVVMVVALFVVSWQYFDPMAEKSSKTRLVYNPSSLSVEGDPYQHGLRHDPSKREAAHSSDHTYPDLHEDAELEERPPPGSTLFGGTEPREEAQPDRASVKRHEGLSKRGVVAEPSLELLPEQPKRHGFGNARNSRTDPREQKPGFINGTRQTESGVESRSFAPPVPRPKDRKKAFEEFNAGRQLYWRNRIEESRRALEIAVDNDTTEPIYYYFLALAQFRSGDRDEAKRTVATAARLEKEHPLTNWGRLMERCQGSARVWLEQQRLLARMRR